MVTIPVNNDEPRAQYSGSIGEDTFVYDWFIFDEDELTVYLGDATTSAFTVTGAGTENGGNVVLDTPLTAATIVTIESNNSIERVADLQQAGKFDPDDYNLEQDKLIVIMKELRRDIDRKLGLDTTSTQDLTGLESKLNEVAENIDAIGAAGGVFVRKFGYKTDVNMADPGAGGFRFDNSTPNLAGNIAVSANSAAIDNPDLSSWIANFDNSTNSVKGQLFLRKASAPQNFLVFDVDGTVTDNSTWLQIPVTNVAFAGSLAADDEILWDFSPAGDEGPAASLTNDSVTNSILANMAANTVKVRAAATTGDPSDLALAASELLGRGDSGDIAAITLGAGLAMTGTELDVVGGSNFTTQVFTASGTWTKPSGCTKVEVIVTGGGGGSSGAGGTSSFGAHCSANGGSGASNAGSSLIAGAVGGSASGGDINITGGRGGAAQDAIGYEIYGDGGSSYWGGMGAYGAGGAATTNNYYGAGAGGTAIKTIDVSAISSETVTIGAAGAASGSLVAGTAGVVLVREYY